MLSIWGAGKAIKPINLYISDNCNVCSNDYRMRVFKTYNYFTFLFIPLIVAKKQYYLVCPCGAAKQITKQEYNYLKTGGALSDAPVQEKILHLPEPEIEPKSESVTVLKPEPAFKPEEKAVSPPSPAELERLIFIDINNAIGNASDLDDDRKFNLFSARIKQELLIKYHDEELVNNSIKKYFQL